MSKKAKCIIEACSNDVYAAGMCRNCYQYAWRWGYRTPKEAVDRLRKLELYRQRMEMRLGGNVKSHGKRAGSKKRAGNAR